jgi:hypothetical protein
MGGMLGERAFHPFLAKFTCTLDLDLRKVLSPTSSLPLLLDLLYILPQAF